MQSVIENILNNLGLLDQFQTSTEFHVKVSVDGFMPLVIERHGSQVIVAHYFEQNGDLVPDPDVEFIVTSAGWQPRAIQHSTGHYVTAVTYENDLEVIRPEIMRGLESFARFWGRNLLRQGFASKSARTVSS